MCEVDTWNAIEAANISLATRLQLISLINEAKKVREATGYQLTETDIQILI